MPALVSAGCVALAVLARGAGAQAPGYTIAATYACLARLPNAVTGLPPATPPAPPALFVDALAHDALSTGSIGPRPRAHRQLGVWYGAAAYEGVILSFFENVPDARASLKTLAGSYGGTRIRNVVATWDQQSKPRASVRDTVFGCLRSGAAAVSSQAPRPASLATFAGRWGGHTRGLAITSSGRGREFADAGCCHREYRLTFQIISVRGTLTRATAAYRVESFRRYERGVKPLHVGAVGKLQLRNGLVTNTLTEDFFCSDPTWDATGACGA
jgi:hypothetical protein